MTPSSAKPPSKGSDGKLAFYRRLCTARYFEGVVAGVLRASGYRVFPYGHEQLLPALRETFKHKTAAPEPVEERLRSNPDLLVIAPEATDGEARTTLVEVKFRNWPDPHDVRLSGIARYQRNWPDAVLAVVLPAGAVFYAQTVQALDTRRRKFDLTRQFVRLDTPFPNVQPATLAAFAADVRRFAGVLGSHAAERPASLSAEEAWSLVV